MTGSRKRSCVSEAHQRDRAREVARGVLQRPTPARLGVEQAEHLGAQVCSGDAVCREGAGGGQLSFAVCEQTGLEDELCLVDEADQRVGEERLVVGAVEDSR